VTARPAWIAHGRREANERDIEGALATIRALLPPSLLVVFSLHLEAMKKERCIGHLRADFHMLKGDVRSCAFERRTSWQRRESVENQKPT
jgi:hypothetical protein